MLAVKKNVFSAVLKLSKDGELQSEHGNRFHAAGPAMMNAWYGVGCPLPIQLRGLGECCKLPEWGPGWSPGRKPFLVHFEAKKAI